MCIEMQIAYLENTAYIKVNIFLSIRLRLENLLERVIII